MNAKTEKESKSSRSEDFELVRAAQKGDEDAFGKLVTKYQGKIYGLAWSMTGNHSDADDLAQKIFLKSFRAIKKFNFRSSFYTWLYRIALNTIITERKKIKRDRHLEFKPQAFDPRGNPYVSPPSGAQKADRQLENEELKTALTAAIDTLPPKQKEVVVMYDIEGMSHGEIAEILSCSEGTVRSRLHYARKKLQKELKGWL